MFGFGEQKTPESFRQACRRFIYTENLLPKAATTDARETSKPLQSLSHAKRILSKVISEMEGEDGWVTLRHVGNQLANLASDFDPRTYGFRKLNDLVRKIDTLEIDQSEPGNLRIRLKPAAKSRSRRSKG